MQPFPTALYAGIFVLATFAYVLLQLTIDGQNAADPEDQKRKRVSGNRNWISASCFVLAVPAAYLHPAVSLSLIFAGVASYFLPNALWGL
jgi:hypothetical protein